MAGRGGGRLWLIPYATGRTQTASVLPVHRLPGLVTSLFESASVASQEWSATPQACSEHQLFDMEATRNAPLPRTTVFYASTVSAACFELLQMDGCSTGPGAFGRCVCMRPPCISRCLGLLATAFLVEFQAHISGHLKLALWNHACALFFLTLKRWCTCTRLDSPYGEYSARLANCSCRLYLPPRSPLSSHFPDLPSHFL